MQDFYNISIKKSQIQFAILFALLFIILSFILFVVVSYFILKMLKSSIEQHCIFFNDYNKQTKKLLEKYGDKQITKVYLVRQPLSKLVELLLNIFSGYKYNKFINQCCDNFPYHSVLIFELKIEKNQRKLLKVDKDGFINISDNFLLYNSQEIKVLSLHKGKDKERDRDKYTLNSILNDTQKRMGIQDFFNWNLKKSNCQTFTKELLVTMNKYDEKNKDFIFRDKLIKILPLSDFTIHIGYTLCLVKHLFFKYILDSEILN